MATQPQAAAPGADSEDQSDMGSDETQGGYVVCVHVDAQGKITVGVETDQEEAQEGGGDESQEEQGYQPVATIREACKLLTQIYNSQGEAPDNAADQADMAAGYGKD